MGPFKEYSFGNFKEILVARPVGLEPTTHGFEDRCSIQLSYERALVTRTRN